MTSTTTLNAHYIPNSHLDREWTMDFQHTRQLTVEFIDSLLEIIEQVPEYQFLMDSQTVPLEDYLEIRPENRAAIKKAVEGERLHIGPWYSAPDMNTISGECITRNLLVGHVMAEEFGRVMKVGYTPFGFVHISQLPQIYAEFGIDTCLFYRGINPRIAPRSEFQWEGPDGTRVLASRMSKQPRYNYYMNIWRKGLYHDQEARLDRRLDWLGGQLPFKICDAETRFDHGTVLKPRRALDESVVRSELDELYEREAKTFRTSELAFMHGFDTSAPEILEDAVLRTCQASVNHGNTLFYSSLPRYIESLKAALQGVELPVVTGEMKHPDLMEGGFRQSYVNIVSTRARQKLRTTRVENLLTRSSEPFAAVAHVLGETWPKEYIDLAWRYFLKCHPHDTVGGCCIDDIEEDTNYRLKQTESVARMVLKSSLAAIVAKVDTTGLEQSDVVITLFNPSPFARSEVVTLYVDVPRELGIEEFVIRDSEKRDVPFTSKPTGNHGKVYRDPQDLALFSNSDEFEVQIQATDLPPMGYETYVLRSGKATQAKTSLVAAAKTMENEHLKVEIQQNGSLNVQFKKTGKQYEGLHVFEDCGEAGHPWMHYAVKNDIRVTSEPCKASITLLSDTPLAASFEVKLTMMIPETTTYDLTKRYNDFFNAGSERTEPLVPLEITSIMTLQKGAETVDIATTVDNKSKNHRLRVLLPTGLDAEHTHAENPYDVIKRPIRRDENHPLRELPNIDYPFLKFIDVNDGANGLAFLGLGMKEYESLDDEKRTLAVTLFRAVENWLCTTSVWDRVPGDMMQILGETTFRYRLFFHEGAWEDSAVYEEAEKLNYPVRPCLSGVEAGGTMPMRQQFFQIDGSNVVLSGVKRAEREDAIVVRVFNPSDRDATATLTCCMKFKSAERADMNEQKKGGDALAVDGETIALSVGPKKVETLLLKF